MSKKVRIKFPLRAVSILLLSLLLVGLFTPVLADRWADPDAPEYMGPFESTEGETSSESLGSTIDTVGEEIDWSAFWQTFKQYALWDLEWSDGANWTSIKSDLQVILDYPEPNRCKITLNFTAPRQADYRLTFAINKLVRDYIERLDKYQYELTFDDILITFDWSDCAEISGLQFKRGVKDGYFWFRIRRDNVPLGAHVVIDPATVATTTSYYALDYPYQRKGFHAAGRFWAFYSDGTNALYESTTDPTDWSGDVTIIGACIYGVYVSVWFDGTYVHYIRYNGYDLFYRRGAPENDGSITWSAVEQKAYDGSFGNAYYDPYVSVDSSGYAWIGARYFDGTYHYPYVLKNANDNGTWTTDFPTQLSTTSDITWKVCPVPLTSDKVYVIYSRGLNVPLGNMYDAGWGTEESNLADYNIRDSYHFSAVANGDDVHFVYNRDVTYQIRYNNRTFGVGWGTDDVLVQDGTTSSTGPALSIDTATDDLYCFWTSTVTDHVYYKQYTSGAWDADPTDWINESTDGIIIDYFISSYYQDYGGYIGLLYTTGLTSPYNIRFEYLTVYVPTDTYTWTFLSTTTTTTATTTSTATDTDTTTITTATTTISTSRTTSTGGSTDLDLWVDSFSDMGGKKDFPKGTPPGQEGSWQTRVAPPPYLNDNSDNWIHEDKTGGATEGYFGFADTAIGGNINSVTLYIECYGDDTNEQIEIYIDSNDGSGYDLEGTVTVDQLTYAYETLNCPSLDTWAEINFASMYLKYIGVAGGDDVYVRRAYLRVNYSPMTTITSCTTSSSTSCETIITTQYTSSSATMELVTIWTVVQIIVDPITTVTVTSQCATTTTVVTSCTTVGDISTVTIEDGTTCTTEVTCTTICDTSIVSSTTCDTSIDSSTSSTTTCDTFVDSSTSSMTTCDTSIDSSTSSTTTCDTSVLTSKTTTTLCETSISTSEICETSCLTSEITETICQTVTVTHTTECETICETSTKTSQTTTTECTTSCETITSESTTSTVTTTCTSSCTSFSYTTSITTTITTGDITTTTAVQTAIVDGCVTDEFLNEDLIAVFDDLHIVVEDIHLGDDIYPLNTTDLEGRWGFNEGSGTNATDTSDNGNHGVITGATYIQGIDWETKFDRYALRFDDTEGDFVNVTYSTDFDNGVPFTIELWYRPLAQTNTTGTLVFEGERYWIYYDDATSSLIMAFYDGSWKTLSSGGGLGTGYTHCVFMYQHAPPNKCNMTMFFNGTQHISSQEVGTPQVGGVDLLFGRDDGTTSFLSGDLDVVRYYNRTMSGMEIFENSIILDSHGYMYSENMLEDLNVTQVVNFKYDSFLSADTHILVQFSQDNSTWVDSGGIAQWEELNNGSYSILLTPLDWAGNFYYRANFTRQDGAPLSPRLEMVAVCYSTVPEGGWNVLVIVAVIAVTGVFGVAGIKKKW